MISAAPKSACGADTAHRSSTQHHWWPKAFLSPAITSAELIATQNSVRWCYCTATAVSGSGSQLYRRSTTDVLSNNPDLCFEVSNSTARHRSTTPTSASHGDHADVFDISQSTTRNHAPKLSLLLCVWGPDATSNVNALLCSTPPTSRVAIHSLSSPTELHSRSDFDSTSIPQGYWSPSWHVPQQALRTLYNRHFS